MKRVLVGLTFAAMLGAACGSGAASTEATTGAAGDSSEMQDAFIEFAECMREQGIDMPDPEVDDDGLFQIGAGPGNDGDPEEFREAREACQHLMPEMEAPSEEDRAEMEDAMLEYAQCMREHGIDMPDPGERGFIIGGGEEEGVEPSVDFDDPDHLAAHEECKDLMPGMLGSEE